MISQETEALLRRAEKSARALWASFIGTLFVLVAISLTVLAQQPAAGNTGETLILPFALVCLITSTQAIFLPKWLTSESRLKKIVQNPSDLHASGKDKALSGLFLGSSILAGALTESIALLGFVLTVLGVPFETTKYFFIFAFVMELAIFPKVDGFIDRLRSLS